MARLGPGEATRKVPVGVEPRKTAVGSDARFARFVRASVVRAIRNGAQTFQDLLLELDGTRIGMRVDTGASASKEGLQSVVRGDVLLPVSRRHPRRVKEDEWTSGNRIYQAGDAMVALEAAYACRNGETDGVARSLWHRLAEEDFAALVDRLRRIASVEAEERAQFARGSHSRFGRAA